MDKQEHATIGEDQKIDEFIKTVLSGGLLSSIYIRLLKIKTPHEIYEQLDLIKIVIDTTIEVTQTDEAKKKIDEFWKKLLGI